MSDALTYNKVRWIKIEDGILYPSRVTHWHITSNDIVTMCGRTIPREGQNYETGSGTKGIDCSACNIAYNREVYGHNMSYRKSPLRSVRPMCPWCEDSKLHKNIYRSGRTIYRCSKCGYNEQRL